MMKYLIGCGVSVLALTVGGHSSVAQTWGQAPNPSYCCTQIGPLGPYPNSSLPEGAPCYGTDSLGRAWHGSACFANEDGAAQFPSYCCTEVGELGPYENTSIAEGGNCFGTDEYGQTWYGYACFAAEPTYPRDENLPDHNERPQE